MIERWVGLWDTREHPRSLATVRILLAAAILWDFVELWRLDLVTELFAGPDAGGWASLGRGAPRWTALVVPDVALGRGWHAALTLAALCLLLGFWTRGSAAVLALLWARHAEWLPDADRGIDVLCRNLLVILAFSRCGAIWSLDAAIRTGSPGGDDAPVPAWPRFLIVLQVVAMYFDAGVSKLGFLWLPPGGFAALYVILQDPAVARQPFGWVAQAPWYPLTQLATAVTLVWEWSAPLLLGWLWLRATAERGGTLRRLALSFPFHLGFLAIGAVFHLTLHATLLLGIFPWAMLATYPAFVHPEEWALLRRGTWLRALPGTS